MTQTTEYDALAYLQDCVSRAVQGKPVMDLDEAFNAAEHHLDAMLSRRLGKEAEIIKYQDGIALAKADWRNHNRQKTVRNNTPN